MFSKHSRRRLPAVALTAIGLLVMAVSVLGLTSPSSASTGDESDLQFAVDRTGCDSLTLYLDTRQEETIGAELWVGDALLGAYSGQGDPVPSGTWLHEFTDLALPAGEFDLAVALVDPETENLYGYGEVTVDAASGCEEPEPIELPTPTATGVHHTDLSCSVDHTVVTGTDTTAEGNYEGVFYALESNGTFEDETEVFRSDKTFKLTGKALAQGASATYLVKAKLSTPIGDPQWVTVDEFTVTRPSQSACASPTPTTPPAAVYAPTVQVSAECEVVEGSKTGSAVITVLADNSASNGAVRYEVVLSSKDTTKLADPFTVDASKKVTKQYVVSSADYGSAVSVAVSTLDATLKGGELTVDLTKCAENVTPTPTKSASPSPTPKPTSSVKVVVHTGVDGPSNGQSSPASLTGLAIGLGLMISAVVVDRRVRHGARRH